MKHLSAAKTLKVLRKTANKALSLAYRLRTERPRFLKMPPAAVCITVQYKGHDWPLEFGD